jgi:phosphate transport system protein
MDRSSERHIVQRYDGELNHLHYLVLEMGGLVIYQLRSGLNAFAKRDEALAQKVMERDREIDHLEANADDTIASVIARRAPMANDLRLAMATSKCVAELERIGDEAVRIARVVPLLEHGPVTESQRARALEVQRMGDMAFASLKMAVEVFDVWDEAKARAVITRQRRLEKAFDGILRRLMSRPLDDSRAVSWAMSQVLVIKALECVGHHSQNLAEYVTLLVKGSANRDPAP